MQWILKILAVSQDDIYRQAGSPDFILTDGRSFDTKRLTGQAVYISRLQLNMITASYPDTNVLVFKPREPDPIAIIPVTYIDPNQPSSLTYGKWGKFYIRLT